MRSDARTPTPVNFRGGWTLPGMLRDQQIRRPSFNPGHRMKLRHGGYTYEVHPASESRPTPMSCWHRNRRCNQPGGSPIVREKVLTGQQ